MRVLSPGSHVPCIWGRHSGFMRSGTSTASAVEGHRAHVAFVVGKAPRPDTVVGQVVEQLRQEGHRVQVRLPHDDPNALDALDAVDPTDALSLVVHRGLSDQALDDLRRWSDSPAGSGILCCNPLSAVRDAADRQRLVDQLDDAGVPVPRARVCHRWDDVRSAAGADRVVVKAVGAAEGRAATVALVDRGCDAPFDGPWMVQEQIANDGLDRKLYVVADRVSGQMKASPLRPEGRPGAQRFEPSAQQIELAQAVGEITGLHLYGVDLVEGPAGPVVVDVNVFPGYRGIAEAPAQVTDHIRTHLDALV